MTHLNKAIHTKAGWIWYDFIGRDYGPYETKDKAEVLGAQRAAAEERLLRGQSKWAGLN